MVLLWPCLQDAECGGAAHPVRPRPAGSPLPDRPLLRGLGRDDQPRLPRPPAETDWRPAGGRGRGGRGGEDGHLLLRQARHLRPLRVRPRKCRLAIDKLQQTNSVKSDFVM